MSPYYIQSQYWITYLVLSSVILLHFIKLYCAIRYLLDSSYDLVTLASILSSPLHPAPLHSLYRYLTCKR